MAGEVELPIHPEVAVLLQVDREPGMINAQLAEQMAREPIYVVGLIDSLQESALIETGGRSRPRPSASEGRKRHSLWAWIGALDRPVA